MFPARPDDGTRVTHIPPVNVVVAVVADGSNVTCESGNEILKAELLIIWFVNRIVTGVDPRPLGFRTPLNQM